MEATHTGVASTVDRTGEATTVETTDRTGEATLTEVATEDRVGAGGDILTSVAMDMMALDMASPAVTGSKTLASCTNGWTSSPISS
ncbi:unnamed protein product, partial [Nesidiocoris tenuis]